MDVEAPVLRRQGVVSCSTSSWRDADVPLRAHTELPRLSQYPWSQTGRAGPCGAWPRRILAVHRMRLQDRRTLPEQRTNGILQTAVYTGLLLFDDLC